ncbi:DgyrCDS7837 [Dimorphilus gyrociliatus]|uniref:phosphatidylinositol-3,5-bisphosphate 3-phosphatase n=1 Tax=Dimorphilus gyrociliatus TaxID=2664684 RepID=A0A7I8VSA6_9ANNE|nr:DgyrCDS7837 [Dimorphilus gyrociliatus]
MSSNPKSALSELMNNAHFQRAFNAIKHGSLQDIIPFQDIWIFEDGTLKVDNVKLIDGVKNKKQQATVSAKGTLYLTATHLIFVDSSAKKEIWILHMHIGSICKQPLSPNGCPLVIRCKTFQVVTFIIPKERDCHDVYSSLLKLSQPAEYSQLFAFHFTPSNDLANESKESSWEVFDLEKDYDRMGIKDSNWFRYDQTINYALCDTYPRFIYMPKGVSKTLITGTSKFRSKGRLPVLSYLHEKSSAAICRCAQPLSGLTARCNEDEEFLQCIISSNKNSSYMFVVDNRPMINALANRAKGKGYENESNYQNIKFHFAGIENIHVMRNSLNNLREACEKRDLSMTSWIKALKDSGWLKHIKDILDAAIFVVDAIKSGTSVLVHCSDGWDRTSQTTSLASIMLDPYYRTIEGFQILILKEWLSFGHKFSERCGHLSTTDSNEVSPVFSQFLDCVWQLTHQFPKAFQFNERLLFELHDHIYSCQFGNFIGNCEKDRLDLRLRENTYSLWSELRGKFNDFLNPFYERDEESHTDLRILKPDTSPSLIRFWRSMYQRWDFGIQPRENVADTVNALKEHIFSLKEHTKLLETRIGTLCNLLNKEEEKIKDSISMISSSESMDFSTLQILDESISGPATPSLTSPDESESGFEESSFIHSSSLECLQVGNLINELRSVAVDWRSLRSTQCFSCTAPLYHNNKKNHCWRCGSLFCERCIGRAHSLPGHIRPIAVPVCKTCSRQLGQAKTLSESSSMG